MEKVLTNEMSKFLIILGIGVISLSVVMARIISRVRGSFKPYRKATILYMLVSLLFFSVIATSIHFVNFPEPVTINLLTLYIFYQVYFLLLGIVHYHLMHKHLRWSGDEKSFWAELIFTIIVGMFGSMAFMAVYRLLDKTGTEYIMATSICFLIIPFFFYHTFLKAGKIPPKVIKLWAYPVHEEIEEPDESSLRNLLVISFEFQKQIGDRHYTNFRAKAPTDMEFGQLFYFFINDYNERHPNSRIQFVNGTGEPHGWIFFKKPKWYSLITEYIDPEKTIYINNIRENDVIICSRSPN